MTNKQIAAEMEALKARLAQAESLLAKQQPKVTKPSTKSSTKVAKPSTKTEAIAKWKAERGITPEGQEAYKQLEKANFEKDWAKWVAKRDFTGMNLEARKAANRAEANRIRNVYRKLAGLPLVK